MAGGGDYLLILTNLHWPTYTITEKENFYEAVAQLAEEHPELPVVWKMHHAEASSAAPTWKYVQTALSKHAGVKERIRFAHLVPELKDKTAAEIIAGAKCVVSTVSTVLLDCEICRRPTAVYGCASNDVIVKMIKKADVFSDFQSLEALFKKGLSVIHTGKLHPYNNAAFRAVLEELYKPSALTPSEFLPYLMSQTFRDDFIARNFASKDSTIASLKKGIEDRNGEIAGLNGRLAESVKENGRLEVELSAAARVAADKDAAIVALEKRVGAKESELADLNGRLAESAKEGGRLGAELSAATRVTADKDAAIAALEKRVEAKEGELVWLNGRLAESVKEGGRLGAELSAAVRVAADKDAAIAALEKRIEEKDGELAGFGGQLAEAVKEGGRLGAELSAAARNLADRDAAIAALEKRIAALEKRIEEKEGEMAGLNGRLAESVKEEGRLGVELSAAARDLADRDAAIAALEKRIVALERRIEEKDCELAGLNSRLAEAVKEGNSLEVALAGQRAICTEQEETIVSANRRIGSLECELAAATARNKELAARNAVAEGERKDSLVKLAESRTKADRLEVERKQLEGRIASIQERESAARRQNVSLQGELSRVRQDLAAVHRNVRLLNDSLAAQSLERRFQRFFFGVMPYGVTSMWKRMAYGHAEDRSLFAYPGFFKKCRRIVKFSMPYFLVCGFRRFRYGKGK